MNRTPRSASAAANTPSRDATYREEQQPSSGAYCTILGNLRMGEQLPDGHQDSRLTLHNGQYHLAVTFQGGTTRKRDPSTRRRTRPRHTHLPHLVFGNRRRPDRQARLRKNPTPLPPPRPAHQQDGQGRSPPSEAQYAQGRGPHESSHNEPHKRASPPGRTLPGRQLRSHPPANIRNQRHGATGEEKDS